MRVGDLVPEAGRERDPDSIVVQPMSPSQLVAADLAISVGYTLALLVSATGPARPPAPGVPAGVVVALVLAIGLPPGLRRVAPVPVLGVVSAATSVALALHAVREPFLATAFVLYVVVQRVARCSRLPVTKGVVAAVALLFAGVVAGTPAPMAEDVALLVVGACALATAGALGRTVQARRRYAARYAEQLAEQAVLAERLRIAREMHDVVTHGLGVIAVKAAVANHVVARRPEEAHDALRVIETTSREALTEMRRMLGVLRAGAPGPGLDTLPVLAERARAAGVAVDLVVVAPDARPLPAGLGLTIHRVVQEALTNVVTHAPGARCTVRVEVSPERVEVTVSDDGPALGGQEPVRLHSHGGSGHGLAGMRERVVAHGGSLAAGALTGGGFGVHAVIPLQSGREAR